MFCATGGGHVPIVCTHSVFCILYSVFCILYSVFIPVAIPRGCGAPAPWWWHLLLPGCIAAAVRLLTPQPRLRRSNPHSHRRLNTAGVPLGPALLLPPPPCGGRKSCSFEIARSFYRLRIHGDGDGAALHSEGGGVRDMRVCRTAVPLAIRGPLPDSCCHTPIHR